MVRQIWQKLTNKCPKCSQNLRSKDSPEKKVHQIETRIERRIASLGRQPRVQSCRECGQIVFEGERGFEESFLLVDYLDSFEQNSHPQIS
jgi:uncharacterized protein with PIN domain